MVREYRRILALALIMLVVFGSMPATAYGQSADRQAVSTDPFEMMADTTPEPIPAEEIARMVSEPNNGPGASDADGINFRADGDESSADSLRQEDALKRRQDLIEQSKTDRFIVKYKKGGKEAFEKKAGEKISKSIDIGRESTNPGGLFLNRSETKTELIILEEKVNPADFAERLREKNAGDDIEYIQPDFKMALNSQDDPPIRVEEPAAEEPITEEQGEPTTGGAITEELEEETVVDETTTEGAILEDLPPEEAQDKVIVAVIDTGIDITHPDLADFIYTNPGELQGNGIDDDGNGYVDDVHGWSFPDNSGAVYDEALGLEQAHGTHIAGIIAGLSDADDHLAPNDAIEILPLKVFRNGVAYTSDIIMAIEYAEMMGAKVVNCSFGSKDNNPALEEAIEESEMLFICSAGNARLDLDQTPVFPACFDLENLISVTSTNADGGLSYFSNYSTTLADVAALGRDISSMLPNGEYGLQSGTSMSTALVSGVAAAVLSAEDTPDPSELGPTDLKQRLLNTSDKLSNLWETVNDGRQINALNAMNNLEQTDMMQNSPENDFDVKGYNPTQTELYQLYSSSSVVQVAAGSGHSMVLKNDGTVWAWGSNIYGQCGNGSTSYAETLVQVIGLTDVISVAAGYAHSLAVKSDGTVWAWGDNSCGQLGDETAADQTIPVQVVGLTDAVGVAAGRAYSLAAKSDGTVWAWGWNDSGQLGDGTTTTRIEPAQVSGLTGAVSVAAGSRHSLAVKSDGTVWAWGWNYYEESDDETTTDQTIPVQVSGLAGIVSASAGYDHSLAVKSDGTVWAWGWNQAGQLGDGTTTMRTEPVQVSGLAGVARASAGYVHSVAVKSDGTVWAWGWNVFGQLGDGTTTPRIEPVQVSGLTGAVSTAAGNYYSLAVKLDGTVWAWGWNDSGQLGDGTAITVTEPAQVSDLTDVTSISAGDIHGVAAKLDGTVWVWGVDFCGSFDGTTIGWTTPVQVSDLTGIVSVAAGDYYSLAVKSDGTVWAWGRNNSGRLGDGTTTDRTEPVQVIDLTDVVSVAAGKCHSLAVKSDGTVWAWGENGSGQLGDGTTTDRTEPVQVNGLASVVSVAAGDCYSLAVKSDGTVWAWGENNSGQLGDGTTTDRTGPVQVSSLIDVVITSAGHAHSVAVKSDGTVWTWGWNGFGQLGDSTTTGRTEPAQVSGLTGIVNVAAEVYHSVAVKSDGTVWTWGDNIGGELGDGTTTGRTEPVQVRNLTDAVSAAAGVHYSLAVKSDRTVSAWGYNGYGQLGQPRPVMSLVPIQSQTYFGLLNFENSKYTAIIPSDGVNTITVSAIGTDFQGNTIPADSIHYSLDNTYDGVSIDSATGAITITPSAQRGIKQVIAHYRNQACSATLIIFEEANLNLNVTENKTYYISVSDAVKDIPDFMARSVAISGKDTPDLTAKTITINYDASALDLVDLCALTNVNETNAGVITGTGITITSVSPGRIVMTVDRTILDEKQWSGVINVFKYKARITGQTTIFAE